METTQIMQNVAVLNIVNLTTHIITLLDSNDQSILLIASSGVARVSAQTTVIGYYFLKATKIPRTHTVYGQIEGLPDPEHGIIYIVSGMVKSALAAQGIVRNDVVVPGNQVRDEQGQVIGCRSLDN